MQLDSAPQVLYVEDDRINIVLMEEVFRRLPGWGLICAESGAEAMELLAGQTLPRLLLIDMNLPDTSGLALFSSCKPKLIWPRYPAWRFRRTINQNRYKPLSTLALAITGPSRSR